MDQTLEIAYLIKHPVRPDTGTAEFNRVLGAAAVFNDRGHHFHIVSGYSDNADQLLYSRPSWHTSLLGITGEFRRAVRRYRQGISGKHVIILAMAGPLSTMAGWLALRGVRVPVILHVADIPSLLEMEKQGRSLRSVLKWSWFRLIEWRIYRRSDHIVVVSPRFKTEIERFGIPSAKISTLTNAASRRPNLTSGEDPLKKHAVSCLDYHFKVIYSGNMTDVPGLGLMLQVAAHLLGQEVAFLVVGDGPLRQEHESKAESMGLTNVIFLGSLSLQESAKLVSACDLALVPLLPGLKSTIPSKTYGAIMSNTPILGTGPIDGALADLITMTGTGVMLPRDPQLVAEVIDTLAGHPELLENFKDREAKCEEIFDIETVYSQFAYLVEALAEGRATGPIDNLRIAEETLQARTTVEPRWQHSYGSSSPALSYISYFLSSPSQKLPPDLRGRTLPSS